MRISSKTCLLECLATYPLADRAGTHIIDLMSEAKCLASMLEVLFRTECIVDMEGQDRNDFARLIVSTAASGYPSNIEIRLSNTSPLAVIANESEIPAEVLENAKRLLQDQKYIVIDLSAFDELDGARVQDLTSNQLWRSLFDFD